MAPIPGQDQPLVWSGWSMIGLDQNPGETSLEIQAVASSGEHRVATRAVTVKSKAFPEENLTVSSKYVEPPKELQDRLTRERAKLKKIYARRGPSTLTSPFLRPAPGDPTSIFGTRRLFNGKPRSPHPGLDLRAGTGTPVQASGDGSVVLAEDLYYSGNIVILDHGGGLFTLYAHLSRIDVAEGDLIRAGQQLGLSGDTGRVTGPHLHWGAKIGDEPFDPTALLDPRLYGK
jgi:murein DD-endopeptidase MepM/ murein hydrolase activator NlpD